MRDFRIKSLHVAVFVAAVLLLPSLALASTSVGNNVSVGGTLGVTGISTLAGITYVTGATYVTGTLQSTGAITAFGNVTLGDAATDLNTLTGYFNTMKVGDLTATSTLGSNTLAVGAVAADVLGKFYVNASGNVSASGTLAVVGATTLTGAVVANGAVTLGDAATDLNTLTGYFNTMKVGDLTATSTLGSNTLAVGAVAADVLGKFYVNASGNVSASGTLAVFGATTLNGAVTLGDAATDLNTLTGYFNTMKVGDLTATSTLGSNTLTVGAVAADVLGKFYVNASGNVSASGTLAVVGATTLTGNTFVTGTLQSTGAVTTYGNVTLGDTVADTTAILSRLSRPLYVSTDGVTATSTLSDTALIINQSSGYNEGLFYVNGVTGDVSATGTAHIFGATTLDGAVTLGNAVTDSITITGKLGPINVSNNTTTSSLANNSFNIAQTQTDNSGKFYVDPLGNVSVSGTLKLPSQNNGSTSTIWVGGLEGTKGQICFGDSDGAGATCIAFQDGSATIDMFVTSTY